MLIYPLSTNYLRLRLGTPFVAPNPSGASDLPNRDPNSFQTVREAIGTENVIQTDGYKIWAVGRTEGCDSMGPLTVSFGLKFFIHYRSLKSHAIDSGAVGISTQPSECLLVVVLV